MKFAILTIGLLGLAACTSEKEAETAKPGEITEAVPETASSDDMIVPDESVPVPSDEEGSEADVERDTQESQNQ